MPIGTEELQAMRDALIRARASATRVVMFEGKRVEYGSDAEMANAIADLETRIRRASAPRPGNINFSTSKGM